MATHSPPAIVIDWLSDHEMEQLLSRPDLCRDLFGQPALLRELITLVHAQAGDAHWYRPARLQAAGHWAAAGGFKGPPRSRVVEIGYRVHPSFRRRGYASALARWLCRAAADFGAAQVVAVTASDNRASQGVLAHNGFVHTGDLLSDSQTWLQRWQYRIPEHWLTPLP